MRKIYLVYILLIAVVPSWAQLVRVENNLTSIGSITVKKTTDSAVTGMIRWTGKDLEGFDGKYWLSLTHTNVMDIDLNLYKTIRIGGQEWFVQNLMTTRYNNGSPIPRKDFDWGNNSSPAYTWLYYDSAAFSNPYGALYNWYVTDPASNGNKNACPVDWGIPTKADFDELKNFLQSNGGMLKDTLFWQLPNTGATNQTGFSAVPAGYISATAGFEDFGFNNFLWSSTPGFSAYSLQLNYNNASINITELQPKKAGFSIRCIRRNYKTQ